MKLRFVFLLIFLIIFNPHFILAQNYKKKRDNSRAAIVEVSRVEKKIVYSFNESVGRIVTLSPYVITSKVNETVKEKYVLQGENLKTGQKLVKLEDKNIKRFIERYKEEIKFNKITQSFLKEELEILNQKLKRSFDLKELKIISEDAYDNLKISRINLNKQIAKINFDLKKLSFLLLSAKEDLESTLIMSPVNGNLIDFNVDTGAMLKKGQKLGSILIQNENEIESYIRSNIAMKLKAGDNVHIKTSSKNYLLGQIRSIVGIENIKTGTRLIKVKLPNNFPEKLNFPNGRIELKIPISDGQNKLVINKDALIANGEKKIVYLVDNGRVRRKSVVIGNSFKNTIEIISGLKENDIIVTKGNENLRNNQPVRVKKLKFSKQK